MEDPQVVAAIVAGDPAGLAEAYDRYAMPLYAYCRSMLPEPADAADAVQDTYLIATAKLRGLRDPGKLRPWLYAVARHECLRRLRAGETVSALEDASQLAAESTDPGAGAERAEMQALVWDAIAGLNPRDRDVVELSLRHDLSGDDLAAVLGVSRNHAHALSSRARGQLEKSLGALIVARTGREACPELDAMLATWDGQLSVLMRKRISRHIEHCAVCGERKRRELSPALFAAGVPVLALAPGFREQLLRVVADRSPAGLAHRLGVANRAGPFGPSGFPRGVSAPGMPWHHALRHSHSLAVGSATSVVAAGVVTAVVIGVPHHILSPGAGGSTHGASVGNSGTGHPGGKSGSGGSGPVDGTSSGTGPAASLAGATGPRPSPGSGSPGGSGSSGGTAPATGSSGGSTAPATSPASSSTTSTTVAQGTLDVSPASLDLVSLNGTATGTLTLTADGGPISHYTVSVGSSVAGAISVSPSSGSLASGASVTVTVTSDSLVTVDAQITVNPGDHTVSVVLSL